ncbi:translocation/assembly module TamB domain-containing protein [uncultured Amphritea sp.]|uniref:translocation/assembly module TamB domain-containing protein n=1 Tax=uncultured Amphritea sp. TaxID=981605 RepID=UPI00261D00B0|nr:translocation/assembly module TamB domain-containing protein [uncultured Amphritea sp.]
MTHPPIAANTPPSEPSSNKQPEKRHRRRIMNRFIKVALSLLALLCILLIVVFFYFVGTNSGLQQLISISQTWLPGQLQIRQINGSILNQPDLQQITYTQPELTASFSRITLDWQPAALLSGKLHIVQLNIEEPVITQISSAETAPEDTATTPVLADITLPIQLQIDSLNISQLKLINSTAAGEPAPATEISQFSLRLHTDADTLILDQLHLVAPQASIDVSGQLQPSGQFPVQLNTQWTLNLAEQQTLTGHGTITGTLKGDKNGLAVQQTLSGLLSTQLSATLENLLEAPQGQLSLSEIKTELGQFTPELSGSTLTGTIEAQGDSDQASLTSQLQTRLPEMGETQLSLKLQLHFADNILRIKQLDLTQVKQQHSGTADNPDSQQRKGLTLKLQGEVDIASAPISFDINGQWNDLYYPMTGKAAYVSPTGKLQISGDLQRYQFSLNSSVAGTDIPTGQWTLTGSGNEHALSQIMLSGKTLEGVVQVSGELAWQPALSWRFNASGKQLNPGSHWAEWPGKLNFQAAVNGAQPADKPLQLELILNSLSGELRSEALTGNGTFRVNGDKLGIPHLQLNIATTEITASGAIDEKLDLVWVVNSPNLNQLLPSLQGNLTGSGSLTGTQDAPHLVAKLDGQNLAFNTDQAASFTADLDINLSTSALSHIQLSASQLNIAGNRWKQLSIDGQGTTDQHTLTLNTEEGPADLQLNLSGRWKDAQWNGTLNKLNLIQQELGNWQLQQPVPVQLSETDAQLNTLCLESTAKENSSLCLSANWSTVEGIQGQLDTQRLSLTHLAPWVPNQSELKGYLQTHATFSQSPNNPPRIKGVVVLKESELLLEEDDLHIIADEITININGRNNQLKADIVVPLQQPTGQLEANISIKDLNAGQNLDGDLNLALDDLKFISLFTPQLQAITGSISSKISIAGTIDKPVVEGHLTLSNATADLPALGIRLEGINLSVIGTPGNNALQLKGEMHSGNGPVALSGQYNPVTDSGEVSLQGERFQAIATEEIQAWVSPSIKLNIEPQKLRLRGEITIPEAKIQPPDIQATAPISDDVVIIDPSSDTQIEAAIKRVLDAQVRITLGDKVYLDALGFEGRLLGSVLIEDDGRQVTRATGIMQVASGQYRLYGQDLNIDRGSLVYSGGPMDNPGLDMRVSRVIGEVTAGAKVSGTLNEPRLSLFSDPSMPESSQLSYLMFGHAPGEGGSSMTEQELLFKAASALTLKGGNTVAEQISETFNIDELGVAGGDTATDTSLYIGKYLSPRLYVKYGVGLLEPTHTFFMRYKLNDAWSVETQSATQHNGGDIIYTIER